MTVQQAFENFILAKQIQGCTEKTLKDYQDFCKPFIEFVGSHRDVSTLNKDLYNKYIKTLYDRKISQSTRATYTRHFKSFVHWVQEDCELDLQYNKIKIPKTPKKVLHIYSPDEIRQIFQSVCVDKEWIVARNQCIIALMLDSGLRQNEVCTIQRKDIDLVSRTLKINGKGNKERIVPIGLFAQRYIELYDKLSPYHHDYFFANIHGEPLTTNSVKLFMQKMSKNLSFPFSSHKLRHNFATNYCINQLEQRGQVDIYSLMILMGHEDVATTERYLHFARQIIASRNTISHLDKLFIS